MDDLRSEEITSIHDYKVCLKSQLSKDIKDKKRLDDAIEAVYSIFLNGVTFGQRGKVTVHIEK